jgi:hypothetical protein
VAVWLKTVSAAALGHQQFDRVPVVRRSLHQLSLVENQAFDRSKGFLDLEATVRPGDFP